MVVSFASPLVKFDRLVQIALDETATRIKSCEIATRHNIATIAGSTVELNRHRTVGSHADPPLVHHGKIVARVCMPAPTSQLKQVHGALGLLGNTFATAQHHPEVVTALRRTTAARPVKERGDALGLFGATRRTPHPPRQLFTARSLP